jgi:DNA-binding CsgD family transcriptional regulator/tetratricopeptide (TPR) repeat protein
MVSETARQRTATTTVLAAAGPLPTGELRSWLGAVAGRHDGRVVESSGGCVIAAFDAAGTALAAAVELQEDAARSNIGLRIGLASGDLAGDDVAGSPPAGAADRLQAAAGDGGILLTDVVRLLAAAQDDDRFEAVGAAIEGVPWAMTAYRLRWAPARPTAPGGPPPPFPSALRPPSAHALVGREDELSSLDRIWQLAGTGGRIALIGGEAGTGKTRLAGELARQLHEAGAAVLLGGCDDDLAVPYQPWVQALEQLVAALPASAARDLAPRLAPLNALLAGDAEAEPGVRLSGDADAARYRLYEAFAGALRAAAAHWPTLIVLEDLHWAGTQTLALLRHLARSGLPAGLAVVGTFRDTGGEISEPLAAVLADLHRAESVTRVRLGRLDADAIERFVAGAIGQPLDAGFRDLAAALRMRSGGNAFLMVELWRHLVTSGVVARSPDGYVIHARAATTGVPDSVREVVAARLAELTPAARAVVEVAAVAGQRVDLVILAAALDVPPDDLDAPLEELVAAGLLAPAAPSPAALVFQFEHALVRETVEATVTPLARRRAHLALAEALAATYAEDHRPVLAELARHFAAAVPLAPVDTAIGYGRQAAAQAARSAAYDEAASHLEAVLELGGSDLQHAQALVDLASYRLRLGLHAPSRSCSRAAFRLASRIGAADVAAEAALQFELATHMPGLPGGPAVELLRRAEAQMGDAVSPLRIRLHASLGRALAIAGQHAAARDVIDVALTEARQAEDDDALLVGLEAVITSATDPVRILAAARELEAVALGRDDVWAVAYGSANCCRAQIALGDLDDASRALERSRRATSTGRFPAFELMTTHLAAILALANGDLAAAERLAQHARSDGATGADADDTGPAGHGVHGVQMFTIRRAQGRLAEVAPLLQLLASAPDPPAVWRPGLVALYVELGMLGRATALFEELAADSFGAVPRDAMWPACLLFLAEACVAVGDAERAGVLAAALEPYRDRNLMAAFTMCFGPADRLLAKLAELRGDTAAADHHFGVALELAERSGSPLWTAEVLLDWAAVCRERGDHARATALGRRGDELAARVGMARRHRADAPRPAEPMTPLPSGLSAREAEVLRCVADGLSNREIGTRLFISQNTVANHIRTILRKTGCANRTEAASFAHRTGVVARSADPG